MHCKREENKLSVGISEEWMTAPDTRLAAARAAAQRGVWTGPRAALARPAICALVAACCAVLAVALLALWAVLAHLTGLLLASGVALGGAIAFLYRRDVAMRAEMARLRLSEERLRDFASTSPDWFWEQDADLRFTELDDITGRLTGPAAARIGKRRWEMPGTLLSESEWESHKADLIARRPFRDFQFWRVTSDGKPRCFSVSGRPVFDADGNFTGYRGIGSDITAQVRAEEARRLTEERFRDFAVTSSDWFWEQDAELRFTYFSTASITRERRFVELYGKTRREAVGDGGITAEAWAAHEADLAVRRPFRDFRYERHMSDGEVRHISVSGTPVFDAKGEFQGYRGIGRDVGAEVRAEAALRQAKEAAEAASLTKSRFLANMSHELRTPLNAILGFSEVIRDKVMGPLDVRYADYGADINRAGQHLLNLIGDVLDLSKIEVGRLELSEEAVDIAESIEACQRLVAERARDGGVSLERDLPPVLPDVLADRLRFKQILLNLLSNAVKFTPAGGRVVVRAAMQGDGGLEIAVIDSGIGMRAEDIPIALAPFRQVDDAFNRKFEGTGLAGC
jgi:PAS domain S-box-containing protein